DFAGVPPLDLQLEVEDPMRTNAAWAPHAPTSRRRRARFLTRRITTDLERFTRRREKRLPRRLAGPVVAVCLSAATSSLRGRYPVVACLVADALSAAGRPTGIGG